MTNKEVTQMYVYLADFRSGNFSVMGKALPVFNRKADGTMCQAGEPGALIQVTNPRSRTHAKWHCQKVQPKGVVCCRWTA
jgi:hypothetical protein